MASDPAITDDTRAGGERAGAGGATEGGTPAASVRDVSRVYRTRRQERRALDAVSLEVGAGEWVALLGPNGSGKSTLLRLIATLERPDSGELEVLGEGLGGTARGRRSVRAQLGVVFQSPSLDPLLSARENLRTQAALFGLRGEAAARAVDEALERLGLAGRAEDRVRTLSGGLARRVDLARALVHGPRMLLLDEATTGLDLASRRAFLDLLDELHRDRGLTIVQATHLMDEAERAQRVVMLHEGRVVADGPPAALRAQVGPAVLRVQGEEAEAMARQLGLEVATVRAGEVVLRGESREQMASAAGELTRAEAAFAVGPPTLADAYLVRTGATLEEDQGEDAGAEAREDAADAEVRA